MILFVAASRLLDILFQKLRWLFYTLTIFLWHKPVPFSTRIYGRIRRQHLPVRLRLGKNCHLSDGVFFGTSRTGDIEIGDNVSINLNSVIVAFERVSIGENTAIAEMVSIRDQAHVFEPGIGVRGGKFDIAPVTIGRNVWIGRGVYIGAGATIGDDCIIAANSTVHGEFPSNVLISGTPARIKQFLEPAGNDERD